MFSRIAAFALFMLPAVACAQSAAPPSAVWTNDHARLVIQSVAPDGRLSGTYENLGGSFACSGTVYPVTGWHDGDRVSFTTLRRDPRNCTAMESWMGVIRGSELVVDIIALGTRGTEVEIKRGADVYRRQ